VQAGWANDIFSCALLHMKMGVFKLWHAFDLLLQALRAVVVPEILVVHALAAVSMTPFKGTQHCSTI
jgi:hypothetical protein